MTVKKNALKGSALLTLSEAVVYGCSFVRNMILARVLTTADFGIAATFALVISLLEFSSRLGIGFCVVRDKDGELPAFIASAHLVQLCTALVGSMAILLCAGPLSVLFGIPNQQWAMRLLALAPILRGLEHLDIRRFERRLRFESSLMVDALPQVVITLAAWPVATWLGDYRAVLLLLLTKGFASTLGSHLMAERPYRLGTGRAYIARQLRFGWPLVINGFLMFGVFQGDQFLIASFYTMADLGPYAAATALTMAPTFFFGRVFNSVMLPVMAEVQEDTEAFARRYRKALAVITLFAMVCSLGMMLGAEALMRVVYGPKYAGAGVLLACLSAANAFRTLRVAYSLAAIAKGDSQNQMIANGWRVVALLPALGLAMAHAPLWSIACCGLVGEVGACWISLRRLRRRDAVPLASSLIATGWIAGAVALVGVAAAAGLYSLPTIVGILLAAAGACVAAAGTIAALPELRHEAAKLYGIWRQVGWRGCLRGFRHPEPAAETAA